eukprot:1137637-Pelagomonas_calceolata.AAC.2
MPPLGTSALWIPRRESYCIDNTSPSSTVRASKWEFFFTALTTLPQNLLIAKESAYDQTH